MNEIWKKIAINEIENIYSASNTGKIKNDKSGFIYVHNSQKHDYYVSVVLKTKSGKKKKYLQHRIIAQTFIPNPNNYLIINHKDGNKQNNCIDNLEWCTQKHNMQCWADKRKGNNSC